MPRKLFKPGQSGNPNGRPKGAKSSVAALRKELITDKDLRTIVDVVVEKAKEGDLTACGMILDRRLPRLRVTENVESGLTLEELVTAANSVDPDTPLPALSRPQRASATSATAATPEPARGELNDAPAGGCATSNRTPAQTQPRPVIRASAPEPQPKPVARLQDAYETGSDFNPYP